MFGVFPNVVHNSSLLSCYKATMQQKPECCLSGWCKRMILALSTPRLWWISLRFRGFFLRKKISYFKDEKEHPLRYSIIRQKGYIPQNRRTYSSCVCIFSVYLIFLLEFSTLFCLKDHSSPLCSCEKNILFENLQQLFLYNNPRLCLLTQKHHLL